MSNGFYTSPLCAFTTRSTDEANDRPRTLLLIPFLIKFPLLLVTLVGKIPQTLGMLCVEANKHIELDDDDGNAL